MATTLRSTHPWNYQPWMKPGSQGVVAANADDASVALQTLGLLAARALLRCDSDIDPAVALLATLPLDARGSWAAVSRRWRSAAAHPSLWVRISFVGVRPSAAAAADDSLLAALCAHAGPGLLELDVRAALRVTAKGVAAALGEPGTRPALQQLRLNHTLKAHHLDLAVASSVHAACPALCGDGGFVLAPDALEEIAPALLELPPYFARALCLRASGRWRHMSFRSYMCLRTAEEIAPLAEVLRIGHVTSLDLRWNQLNEHALGALCSALAQPGCAALIALRMGGNNLGDAGAAMLAATLSSNRTLQVLDLRGNGIKHTGAVALGAALGTDGMALRALHLGGNPWGASGGARALADGLARNASLTTLRLGSCNVGEDGVRSLAAALRVHPGLRTLALDDSALDDIRVALLAATLPECRALTELDLFGNSVTDAGVASLAGALQSGSRLQVLHLGNNCIGDAGAIALARALEHDDVVLRELMLDSIGVRILKSNERVGDFGAEALAASLMRPGVSLTRLTLRWQRVGIAGAAALARALAAPHGTRHLEVLDMSHNTELGDAGTAAFAPALARRQGGALATLLLAGTGAGDGAATAFADALRSGGAAALSTLDLKESDISAAGAEALGAALIARRSVFTGGAPILKVILCGTPAARPSEVDCSQITCLDQSLAPQPPPPWRTSALLLDWEYYYDTERRWPYQRADEDETSDEWALVQYEHSR